MRLFNYKEKILWLIVFVIGFGITDTSAQIAINTDKSIADGSAMLDVKSTDKGMLIPTMTAAQRDLIATPAVGLMIYCSDGNEFYYYYDGLWNLVGGDADNDWVIDENDIYSGVTGNIGIGTSTPTQQIELSGSLKMPNTTSATTGILFQDTAHFMHDYLKPGNSGANLFLGYFSGNMTMGGSNTEHGTYNVGIGDSVLCSLTSGSYNTSTGMFSNRLLTEGSCNTSFGGHANWQSTSTNHCVSIGFGSLAYNTVGNNNTAIGQYALINNATGSNNIGIGYFGGRSIISGNHNIDIGIQTELLNATANNQLNIANTIFGTDIDGSGSNISSGNIGIGVIEPQKRLHVDGDIMFGGFDSGDFMDILVSNKKVVFLQDYDNAAQLFTFELTDRAGSYYSFNSGSNELMRLTTDAKLGIGTSSPDYSLQVDGVIAPEIDGQDIGIPALRWDANMNSVAADSVTVIAKLNIAPRNTQPPSSEGSLWVDNSTTPPQIKCYLNGNWVRLDNE